MSANERQVGGSHYRSALQHWDVVEDYGIGYLEGCATKYVTRWNRKGTPVTDLEKCCHYIQKLIEKHNERGRNPRGAVPHQVIEEFVRANSLGQFEAQVVTILLGEWDLPDLERAHTFAQALLEYVRDDPRDEEG